MTIWEKRISTIYIYRIGCVNKHSGTYIYWGNGIYMIWDQKIKKSASKLTFLAKK